MQEGLYDKLITTGLAAALDAFPAETVLRVPVSDEELVDYLVGQIASELKMALGDLSTAEEKVRFYNSVVESVSKQAGLSSNPEVLLGLKKATGSNLDIEALQPEIPLRQLALLTNAKAEPRMGQSIQKELRSADRVDILMSFVKVSGLRLIYQQLQNLSDRGIQVRLITSCYIGATELEAVQQLVKELNVQVKVDYLARANRLHAKAWLLHRETGYTTAYIGSSNLSRAAMWDGLEWNVRFSAERAPEVISKMRAAFESYWNSSDFEAFSGSDADVDKLEEALIRAKGFTAGASQSLTLSMLDVKPWPYQQNMLDEIWFEREVHGKHRNLVVAATGTGKTVLSALDYQRLGSQGKRPKLLFVAHTKEILNQACSTFRQVLKDTNFGELWVDGLKPVENLHVFASIQTLSIGEKYKKFSRDYFDVIIVDEFHHATAETYSNILDYFQPLELVGLTATPERTNGDRVQDAYFDGRIASELRLWDALDQELLAPFNYFGISDEVDYAQVDWSKGRYDSASLDGVLSRDTARARLIFNELRKKYGDLADLKALAFCAGRQHAEYMTAFFNENGLPAGLVLGDTSSVERETVISKFRSGALKVLVSVSVFNEGFDVPDANAILMLRPTESPVVFLQQLGRGLRRSAGKESVLVLDFVGNHRAEYRQDLRLSILSGRSRGELEKDIEAGFPYLPSGVTITLDKKTREGVLASIKKQVAPTEAGLVAEVRSLGAESLREYLTKSGRELWEIYRHKGLSWTKLRDGSQGKLAQSLRLAKIRNFTHVNDAERLEMYSRILSDGWKPWEQCSELEKRFAYMFLWNYTAGDSAGGDSVDEILEEIRSDSAFCLEFQELADHLLDVSRNRTYDIGAKNLASPFQAHANYTRSELLGGLGWSTLPKSPLDKPSRVNSSSKPGDHREGVAWLPLVKTELLFVTLKKGSGFSESTSYHDYAENQEVFHWDSQNRVRASSETGQRYQNHQKLGVEILLAVRESNEPFRGFTPTFRLAGLADYLRHEGEAPMSIWWKLRQPLDLETWKLAAAVRVA